MRVRMGQTISQSTVVLEHCLPGSSPTRHFDRREDPGNEVGKTYRGEARQGVVKLEHLCLLLG